MSKYKRILTTGTVPKITVGVSGLEGATDITLEIFVIDP